MYTAIRKLLCVSLALLLIPMPFATGQQASPSAPVPPQITAAHTIFVSNGGGSNYFNAFTGGPDRGYTKLLAALEKWNRFQIVQSPSQADLIFEIHAVAPALASPGNDIPSGYNPQLVLRIRDPKTNALLWTTTANVKAAGTQKSRDRGFDQSVAVLADRVRQLTGEQLTSAQAKAIQSNTHMSNSAKIFIGVSIGAAVGFTIFGIYKVTHRSMPTPPTPYPPCLTGPVCPI